MTGSICCFALRRIFISAFEMIPHGKSLKQLCIVFQLNFQEFPNGNISVSSGILLQTYSVAPAARRANTTGSFYAFQVDWRLHYHESLSKLVNSLVNHFKRIFALSPFRDFCFCQFVGPFHIFSASSTVRDHLNFHHAPHTHIQTMYTYSGKDDLFFKKSFKILR